MGTWDADIVRKYYSFSVREGAGNNMDKKASALFPYWKYCEDFNNQGTSFSITIINDQPGCNDLDAGNTNEMLLQLACTKDCSTQQSPPVRLATKDLPTHVPPSTKICSAVVFSMTQPPQHSTSPSRPTFRHPETMTGKCCATYLIVTSIILPVGNYNLNSGKTPVKLDMTLRLNRPFHYKTLVYYSVLFT